MARQRQSASPERVGIRNMMGGAAVKSDLPPIPSKISTAYGSPIEAALKPTRRRAGASIKEVVNDIIIDARSDLTLTGHLNFDLSSPADTPQSDPSAFMARTAGRTPAKKNTPKTKNTPAVKGTPATKGKGKGKGKTAGMTTSGNGGDLSPDPISQPIEGTPTPTGPSHRTPTEPTQTSLPPVEEEDPRDPSPSPSPTGLDFPPSPNLSPSGSDPNPTKPPSLSPSSGAGSGSGSPKHPRDESDGDEASQSPPAKKKRGNPLPFDKSVAHVRYRPTELPARSSTLLQPPVPTVSAYASPARGLLYPGASDAAPGSAFSNRTFGDAESILDGMEAHRTPPSASAAPAVQDDENPFQDLGPAEHTPPPPDARSLFIDPRDGSYTYSIAPPSVYDPIALNPHRKQRRIRYPLPGAPNTTPGGTRYYQLPGQAGKAPPPTADPPRSNRPSSNTTPVPVSKNTDDVDMTTPTPGPRDDRRPPPTLGLLQHPGRRPSRSRSASPPRSPAPGGPPNRPRSRSPVGSGGRPGDSGDMPNGPSNGRRPGSQQGGQPTSRPGTGLGSSSGTRPDSFSGVRPGSSSGARPGSSSGAPLPKHPGVTRGEQPLPPNFGLNRPSTVPQPQPGPKAPSTTGSQPHGAGSQGNHPRPVQLPLPPVQASTNPTENIPPTVPLAGSATGENPRLLFTKLSQPPTRHKPKIQSQPPPQSPPPVQPPNDPANIPKTTQGATDPLQASDPIDQLGASQTDLPASTWWNCLINTWPFRRHTTPAPPGRPNQGGAGSTASANPHGGLRHPTPAGGYGGVRPAPVQAGEELGFFEWLVDDIRRSILISRTWLSYIFGGVFGSIVYLVVGLFGGIGDLLYALFAWLASIIDAGYVSSYNASAASYAWVRSTFSSTQRSENRNPTAGIRPITVEKPRPATSPGTRTDNGNGAATRTSYANSSSWFRAIAAIIVTVGLVYCATRLLSHKFAAQSISDEIFPPSHSPTNWSPASYSRPSSPPSSNLEVSRSEPFVALVSFLSSIWTSIWIGMSSLAKSVKQAVPSMRSPPAWFSPTEAAAFDQRLREIEHTVGTLNGRSATQGDAIDRLRQQVPNIIQMEEGADGKPKIPESFYFALRDLMKKDEEVLTLHKNAGGSYQLSDHHYEAIRAKYAEMWSHSNAHRDDGEASGRSGIDSREVLRIIDEQLPTSWINWVTRNQERVNMVLAQAGVTGSITDEVLSNLGVKPDTLVTREQFLSKLGEEFGKHSSRIMAEVDSYMKQTGTGHVRDVVDGALRERGVDDMSNRRILALVEDRVRYILGSAGLQGLAKAKVASIVEKEVGSGVNFFGPGTGAIINPQATSPRYVPERPSFLSQAFRREWRAVSPQPHVALRPWDDFGDCWCGSNTQTHANKPVGVSLSVNMAHMIAPSFFVMEHIPAARSLEPEAVPDEVELWAFIEDRDVASAVEDTSRRFFYDGPAAADVSDFSVYGAGWVRIGQFRYRPEEGREGAFVYRIPDVLLEAGLQTDRVTVRAVNNVGRSDHTCIYRVKLFGQKVDSYRPMKEDEIWP